MQVADIFSLPFLCADSFRTSQLSKTVRLYPSQWGKDTVYNRVTPVCLALSIDSKVCFVQSLQLYGGPFFTSSNLCLRLHWYS